jgi:hypothetical protein
MSRTVDRPRMLSRFVGELDPDLHLLVYQGLVRSNDVKIALHISRDDLWHTRLAQAGIVPITISGIARTKWITVEDAKRLLDEGGTT